MVAVYYLRRAYVYIPTKVLYNYATNSAADFAADCATSDEFSCDYIIILTTVGLEMEGVVIAILRSKYTR